MTYDTTPATTDGLLWCARALLCNVSDSLPATTEDIKTVADVEDMLRVLTDHAQALNRDLVVWKWHNE
jgi:hypothetical protein